MFDFIFNIKGLPGLEAKLDTVISNQNLVMKKIEELTSEIAGLRQASADEKEEVRVALKNQTDAITRLEQQLADGASPEQLQAAIDEVKTAKAEIAGIYNLPATSPNPTSPNPTSPNPGDGGTVEFPQG